VGLECVVLARVSSTLPSEAGKGRAHRSTLEGRVRPSRLRRRLLQKSDMVIVTQEYKPGPRASDLLTALASASGLYCNSLRREGEVGDTCSGYSDRSHRGFSHNLSFHLPTS